MGRSLSKILFLDESGDHNLAVIDSQHPVFVLGGIVVDREYALEEMERKLNIFKQELFGTTDVTLHTVELARCQDFRNPFFARIRDQR